LKSAAMPLPVSEVERELTHTRRVRYEGYKRADGLWDLEAHLLDTKNHDFHLKTGVRRAGQAVHDMWLRVTIDSSFTVLDAQASMDAVPYPGGCENIPPAYKKLIGLNLVRGFRKRVWEQLGGVKGGGVKVAKSLDEVRARAKEILGMQLKTHQTGPAGQKVRRLLVEEGADIKKEMYAGMVVDRGTQRVVLMASSEGGMDIEEVA